MSTIFPQPSNEAQATSVSDEVAKVQWNDGVDAAKAALANSDKPIFLMDEMPGPGLEPDHMAMGWNSVWASEENSERWRKYQCQE